MISAIYKPAPDILPAPIAMYTPVQKLRDFVDPAARGISSPLRWFAILPIRIAINQELKPHFQTKKQITRGCRMVGGLQPFQSGVPGEFMVPYNRLPINSALQRVGPPTDWNMWLTAFHLF